MPQKALHWPPARPLSPLLLSAVPTAVTPASWVFLGVSWPRPACPSLSACCCQRVGVARRSRLARALSHGEQGRRRTLPADGAVLH